mmetsp:Transcript_6091/g.21545  ORF Transcript_6091/g.21545 Transcript_6091/m.21545 type:complete len:130 (+) Transcript_6091:873-1262(+)
MIADELTPSMEVLFLLGIGFQTSSYVLIVEFWFGSDCVLQVISIIVAHMSHVELSSKYFLFVMPTMLLSCESVRFLSAVLMTILRRYASNRVGDQKGCFYLLHYCFSVFLALQYLSMLGDLFFPRDLDL